MNISKQQMQTIISNAPPGVDTDKLQAMYISKGYNIEGVDSAKAQAFISQKYPELAPKPVPPAKPAGRIKEAIGDVTGIVSDIRDSSTQRSQNIDAAQQRFNTGEQGLASTVLQTGGQYAGAGADAIGAAFKGAANLAFSDKTEKDIADVIGKFGAKVMAVPQVQEIINKYNNLSPEEQANVDAIGGIVNLVSNFVGAGAATKAGTVAKQGINAGVNATKQGINTAVDATVAGAKTATNLAKSAAASDLVQGATRVGTDIIERIPRAIERGKIAAAEQSAKAARIKSSTPEVANAIKAKLDDNIIRTVTENITPETAAAHKKIVELASTSTPNGVPNRPEIVAGDAAADQYKRLDSYRKAIGKDIEAETKSLSTQGRQDVTDTLSSLDNTLSDTGVVLNRLDDGSIKLERGSSSYTNEQLGKMQELYNVANETGRALTPSEMYAKTRLFSTLKREAKMAKIADTIVSTPDGPRNLFDIFSEGFTNKLETISPNIRQLNRKYAPVKQLLDDLDDSIFKSGNFNASDAVDPARFAQTNLRRIFSDAQSAASYDAIASQLDNVARQLGYKGANPAELSLFATRLRKLFPESVPETSATNIFKGGVQGAVEKVLEIGAPNLSDQQKAIRMLVGLDKPPVKGVTPPKRKSNGMKKGFVTVMGETKDVSRLVNKKNPYSKAAANLDDVDRKTFDTFLYSVNNKIPITKELGDKVDRLMEVINEAVGEKLFNPNGTDLSKLKQISLMKDADRELTKKALKIK